VGKIYLVGIEMKVVKVDSKGRITIPREIREKVGLKKGDYARIRVDNGNIVVEPYKPVSHRLYGKYRVDKWPEDLDKFLAEAIRRWWLQPDT